MESYGRTVSKATLKIWIQALADLEPAAVEQAVVTAIRSSRQMPSVAELRELAGAVRVEDRALLAWGAVERAVSRVGAYRHVSFDDPVINAAIRSLGGWAAVCGKPPDEFDKWTRQDFIKAYGALVRSGVNCEMCAPLAGLSSSGPVKRIDGTVAEVSPPVQEIVTGLPWAGEAPKRLGETKRKAPRLEFQKP
jgi:hypothetical protein